MKEKIPFYNIINMFFVGSVFSFIVFALFFKEIEAIDYSKLFFAFVKDWTFVISAILIIIMYEIGFILNRSSSIIIAPILEKTKIWPKYPYDKDISEICETNAKFQSIIADLVLMRTHILMYLLIGVISLFSPYKFVSTICIVLIAIMILAGRKHNSRINIIRESVAKSQKEKAPNKGMKDK